MMIKGLCFHCNEELDITGLHDSDGAYCSCGAISKVGDSRERYNKHLERVADPSNPPPEKPAKAGDGVQATPSALDTQEGGDHYKNSKIQPVEFIVANNIPFREANVIKYVFRHKAKNGLEDLKKARHYLQMLIEEAENV